MARVVRRKSKEVKVMSASSQTDDSWKAYAFFLPESFPTP